MPEELGYRPALDGVRAVAVLSVMLFHGGVAVTSGGFLGVDIFFVLSGFLITSLLLQEHDRAGRLDFAAFWGRRARRLLPALFVVLAVVLLVGWLSGLGQGSNLRGDSLATLFYVSNWWFIGQGQSYFDAFNDPSALTHTWSLAIEEQWYLILPILLIPLLRWLPRSALAALFLGAAALSACSMAALRVSGADDGRVYYGTDTRVQALLVGAALAVLFTQGALERLAPSANAVGIVAAIAVLAFIAFASETSGWLYFGGFLVFAVVAAALVLSVMADPDSLLARVLSVQVLVAIGTISYGLYLWHWPLYVYLSPTRTHLDGIALLALRFAATFAAAIASYFLVERPIRRGAWQRATPKLRLGVAVAVPAALVALAVIVVPRPAVSEQEALEAYAAAPPQPVSAVVGSQGTPSGSASGSGSTGMDRAKVSAILVGDSNALTLVHNFQSPMTKRLVVRHGTNFGCGVIPYTAVVDGTVLEPKATCRVWRKTARANWIRITGAQVGVLMAGSWEQYDRWVDGRTVRYDSAEWHDATVRDYRTVLTELAQTSQRLAVVTNSCHRVPDPGLPLATMYQAGRVPSVVNDPKRIAATNRALREAATQMDVPVQVIDLNAFLCPDGYTETYRGAPLRTDGLHFSEEASARIWRWLGPQLRDGSSPQSTGEPAGTSGNESTSGSSSGSSSGSTSGSGSEAGGRG